MCLHVKKEGLRVTSLALVKMKQHTVEIEKYNIGHGI